MSSSVYNTDNGILYNAPIFERSDTETIALYQVPGPFSLKEIFVSREEMYENIIRFQQENILTLQDYSYFDDIKIYDCNFKMSDSEIEFPNTNIGPFAELWFRNPNVFLNGYATVEINFRINNSPKQIILHHIDITGTLISKNGLITWQVWCKPQVLYCQIQLIIDTYENIQDIYPILNPNQEEKLNEVKHYFNDIKDKAETNFNYFRNNYNNDGL